MDAQKQKEILDTTALAMAKKFGEAVADFTIAEARDSHTQRLQYSCKEKAA
ncbi:MAG: hypothetical protein ACYC63_04990 [Armatimonadota bacterium]